MSSQNDFVDRRNLNLNTGGRNLIIVTTVFLFFDFVFIGIRLYTRRITRKDLAINDYAILVGFTLSAAGYGLQVFQVVYTGLGIQGDWIVVNLGVDRFRLLMKCIFASNILFNACTMAIKISILHLYLTIFDSVAMVRRLIWGTMVLTVLFHTAVIVEICLICKPLAYFWDLGLTIKEGTCGSAKSGQMAKFVPGVMGLALDIVIFAVVVVSAVRLSYIFEHDSDLKFAITGCVEPTVGIMVACTPMVKHAVEHLSGGRIVLWSGRLSQPSGKSTLSMSWPMSSTSTSQQSYVSRRQRDGPPRLGAIEEGDVPLVELVEPNDRSPARSSDEVAATGSVVAEAGRIRMTRDSLEDT